MTLDTSQQMGEQENKMRRKEAPETVVRELAEMIQLPGPDFKQRLRNSDVKPHSPSSHELEELDHTIVNVAYQVEQLLIKFQWLQDVDLGALATNPNSDQLVRSIVQKFRVRLAAVLVRQYWQDQLPIMDCLVYLRHCANLQSLPQVYGGELTATHMDELQALLLQAAVDTMKLTKQRISGDNAVLDRSQTVVHDLKKAVRNKKKNNLMKSNESPAADVPESGSWPPLLPEIGNDLIAKQVFTHRSAIVDTNMVQRADIIHTHNERLEFKGDSILDFIVCDMLFTNFPNDNEGALSIKKASLVCNDTLFDLSVTYKLHERLQTSKDLRDKIYASSKDGLPDPHNKNKAIADVFEAYIAGVALDQGLLTVQKWLWRLYEPLVADMRLQKTADEVNKNAKNELYRKVGSAQQQIQYIVVDGNENSESFTVVCRIAGEEVAKGTDRSVKTAGLRAAMAALKKPDLVEKYASKRREQPRSAAITGPMF